jgi:hypothetical protein
MIPARGRFPKVAAPAVALVLVYVLAIVSMAPTVHAASVVVGTYGSSTSLTTSGSASFSGSVTPGDIIVAAFGTSATISAFTMSDTRCGAFANWHQVGSTVTNTATVRIYYCTATSSGTDTISVSWTTNSRYTLDVYDLTGYTAAGATTAPGTGTSGAPATSSFPFSSGSMLVAIEASIASRTVSALTGSFTTGDATGTTLYSHGEYATSGITSPTTFSMTLSSSTTWAEIGAQFPVAVTLPVSCTMAEAGATAATI